ncbi:sugar transferase [Adhaeribacter aquaticus]|uniref:sugar transferase n=1 Tax=Adhaeribacter aquaticus TaxID=299567 RepID=UPI00047AE43B|nr:sugar transferase [Adhaeribacter aquaticus]
MYKKFFKRFLDVGISLIGLLAALPLLVIIAVLLFFLQKGAVLFRQQRPGLHGRLFTIYKFKTMSDACAPDGALLPDGQRLTKIGLFIRKYSLDELPQLWNVLRGDLSLVGPRPLLIEYLVLYTPEQARRHSVKPGITGWAQVNGRNAISWEQKFNYDTWYADHVSFLLDLRILLLTFTKIFKNSDTTAPGSATAERFTGTIKHAS